MVEYWTCLGPMSWLVASIAMFIMSFAVRRYFMQYLAAAVIISILALLIVSLFIFNPFSGQAPPPMKTTQFTSLPGGEESPTFSPDGRQIAFSWLGEENNNPDIYVKLIKGLD